MGYPLKDNGEGPREGAVRSFPSEFLKSDVTLGAKVLEDLVLRVKGIRSREDYQYNFSLINSLDNISDSERKIKLAKLDGDFGITAEKLDEMAVAFLIKLPSGNEVNAVALPTSAVKAVDDLIKDYHFEPNEAKSLVLEAFPSVYAQNRHIAYLKYYVPENYENGLRILIKTANGRMNSLVSKFVENPFE